MRLKGHGVALLAVLCANVEAIQRHRKIMHRSAAPLQKIDSNHSAGQRAKDKLDEKNDLIKEMLDEKNDLIKEELNDKDDLIEEMQEKLQAEKNAESRKDEKVKTMAAQMETLKQDLELAKHQSQKDKAAKRRKEEALQTSEAKLKSAEAAAALALSGASKERSRSGIILTYGPRVSNSSTTSSARRVPASGSRGLHTLMIDHLGEHGTHRKPLTLSAVNSMLSKAPSAFVIHGSGKIDSTEQSTFNNAGDAVQAPESLVHYVQAPPAAPAAPAVGAPAAVTPAVTSAAAATTAATSTSSGYRLLNSWWYIVDVLLVVAVVACCIFTFLCLRRHHTHHDGTQGGGFGHGGGEARWATMTYNGKRSKGAASEALTSARSDPADHGSRSSQITRFKSDGHSSDEDFGKYSHCGEAHCKNASGHNVGASSSNTVARCSQTLRSDLQGEGVFTIMGKYKMTLSTDDVMGEGSSSICRKGEDLNGEPVAIKVLKNKAAKEASALSRFKRQVEVLQQLQLPFTPGTDRCLWHPFFGTASPASLFMVMLDYSKMARKQPGPDPADGLFYVISELAEFSLKDFIDRAQSNNFKFSASLVKDVTRSLLRVVAGLHLKGFVHLDLKPENIMSFSGCWKLIDVDGCTKAGTTVKVDDDAVCYSPCYCSPQWAQFLLDETSSEMAIQPSLDVWSLGMTLAELVNLEPVMQPAYVGMIKKCAGDDDEASYLFLNELKQPGFAPTFKGVDAFDEDFKELLVNGLLIHNAEQRRTCAQCLDHEFVLSAEDDPTAMPDDRPKHQPRKLNKGTDEPQHQGKLWQLIDGGDPEARKDWVEHDAWLDHQAGLCHFNARGLSQAALHASSEERAKTIQQCTIVLLASHMLSGAQVSEPHTKRGPRGSVFEVKYEDAEGVMHVIKLAAGTLDEAKAWVEKLQHAARTHLRTKHLGDNVTHLRHLQITVKNRRMSISPSKAGEEGFQPIFKEMLWNSTAAEGAHDETHWRERETWITKNGNLVYSSQKDSNELLY